MAVARMNKAALKWLCSLLADIIPTLMIVDGCSNLLKATGKKGYVLLPFSARLYRPSGPAQYSHPELKWLEREVVLLKHNSGRHLFGLL